MLYMVDNLPRYLFCPIEYGELNRTWIYPNSDLIGMANFLN